MNQSLSAKLARRLLIAVMAASLGVTAARAADERPVTIEDIMKMRAVASAEISPDGDLVLYTVRQWEPATDAAREAAGAPESDQKMPRMEARTHIFRVATAGGPARQLTFGERGETSPRWSPDGRFVSFLAARGGTSEPSEDGPRPQIWVMPADGGEPWAITTVKEGVTAYSWSPDSKLIAFTARDPLSTEDEARRKRRDDARVFEGDFRMAHLWVVEVASKKDKRLTEGTAFTVRGTPSWSPDAKRIVFAAAPTPMIRDDRDDLLVVPSEGGEIEKIAATPASESSPQWSPDGKTIAYVAEPAGPPIGDGVTLGAIGNGRLMLYDVATRTTKDASSPEFDLSPGQLQWDATSDHIGLVAGVRVHRDFFTYTLASGTYRRTTTGLGVSSFSYSRGDTRMAFTADGPGHPTEVFCVDAQAGSLRKLTDTNPEVKDLALGETEVITWHSTDGMKVEGILLKPVGFEAGKRYPLMVVVHGGPTGAHVNSFRVSYGDGGQFWAGRGWAVLYPNPRGSTNYGERFMQGNIPDWGGGDYRDIMTGVDAVIARGIADPDKLAVQGWSYGGYMTAWIVSQTSRFKAAMMGAGLSNLASMYNTTDIPAYMGRFFNGIPSANTMALLNERSGIAGIDKVTTPVLILHGANDERVPIGQPMEFYRALKDRGRTTELVFYPREGHGLSEYYHQLDRLKRQHDWIVKHTLGERRKTTS